jgi:hypothetical protein
MEKDRTFLHINVIFGTLALALFFAWAANSTAYAETDAVPHPGAQVSVAGNGQTIVRDAVVVERSGSHLVVETAWGEAKMTWRVFTSGVTKFVPASGNALASISAGDIVTFSGQMDMSRGEPTVYAAYVKDTSLMRESVTLEGTVTSRASDSSFTFDTGDSRLRVVLGSGTFLIWKGESASSSSLSVGDAVQVAGTLDTMQGELYAGRVDIIQRAESAHAEGTGVFDGLWKFLKTGRGILSMG